MGEEFPFRVGVKVFSRWRIEAGAGCKSSAHQEVLVDGSQLSLPV